MNAGDPKGWPGSTSRACSKANVGRRLVARGLLLLVMAAAIIAIALLSGGT